MQPPILRSKHYAEASVFTVENMLREARRQKALADGPVPPICILDPDGDIVENLLSNGQAERHPLWACYHSRMYQFESEEVIFGIVPHIVGASFAVLVAEELFASGCHLIISMTSAGQIVAAGSPPYFVLIERALRDEGTSYHYLPPAEYSAIDPGLLTLLDDAFTAAPVRVLRGSTWTTDAPFRETQAAIDDARSRNILGVEMEAAALYAYAEAHSKAIVCFAHITNQMAQFEGDFEKGLDQGSRDALAVITLAAQRWLMTSNLKIE